MTSNEKHIDTPPAKATTDDGNLLDDVAKKIASLIVGGDPDKAKTDSAGAKKNPTSTDAKIVPPVLVPAGSSATLPRPNGLAYSHNLLHTYPQHPPARRPSTNHSYMEFSQLESAPRKAQTLPRMRSSLATSFGSGLSLPKLKEGQEARSESNTPKIVSGPHSAEQLQQDLALTPNDINSPPTALNNLQQQSQSPRLSFQHYRSQLAHVQEGVNDHSHSPPVSPAPVLRHAFSDTTLLTSAEDLIVTVPPGSPAPTSSSISPPVSPAVPTSGRQRHYRIVLTPTAPHERSACYLTLYERGGDGSAAQTYAVAQGSCTFANLGSYYSGHTINIAFPLSTAAGLNIVGESGREDSDYPAVCFLAISKQPQNQYTAVQEVHRPPLPIPPLNSTIALRRTSRYDMPYPPTEYRFYTQSAPSASSRLYSPHDAPIWSPFSVKCVEKANEGQSSLLHLHPAPHEPDCFDAVIIQPDSIRTQLAPRTPHLSDFTLLFSAFSVLLTSINNNRSGLKQCVQPSSSPVRRWNGIPLYRTRSTASAASTVSDEDFFMEGSRRSSEGGSEVGYVHEEAESATHVPSPALPSVKRRGSASSSQSRRSVSGLPTIPGIEDRRRYSYGAWIDDAVGLGVGGGGIVMVENSRLK
ncbi:hypothetical protein BJ742DRAFT_773006 [Cladochytrium replicatum]|nr:hypothetical protein BJ742DRAFT_773006 [Cladochytrium replicatum]